jgi:CheY-like chemotaxis protein
VQVVYHPETALEAARSQIPDIVLLDIGLPSMDGYELASSVTKWDHY